ncbi:MAG TPA: c-type cytochrome domain-containing protein [Fimbriimonadaceae bacterium]|nr:c-type cytochrome domain-containing protein [Fimbriimonadaceae bacterium]
MRKVDTAALVLGIGLLVAGIGCNGGAGTATASNTAGTTPTQAQQVQQILKDNCMPCHASGRPSGATSLDTMDGIKQAIVPKDAAKSRIVIRMTGSNGQPTMPLNRPKLSDDKIKTVEDWINAGAPTS